MKVFIIMEHVYGYASSGGDWDQIAEVFLSIDKAKQFLKDNEGNRFMGSLSIEEREVTE